MARGLGAEGARHKKEEQEEGGTQRDERRAGCPISVLHTHVRRPHASLPRQWYQPVTKSELSLLVNHSKEVRDWHRDLHKNIV